MSKRLIGFLVLLFSLSLLTLDVQAATQIGGNITTNTTLGPTGSPADVVYEVVSTLTLSGATLTIQPGTVLKFRPGTGIVVIDGGNLQAIHRKSVPGKMAGLRQAKKPVR